MQQAKRRICFLLSALMLMSALSGCAEREVPEEERFVLSACVCGSVTTLDPAANTDARAESVFRAVYENLLRPDESGEGGVAPVPGIAKEYREVVNFDGTVDYVFTLRSSARWSDGARVKAKDFAYAWRRLADPANELPNHALLSMVKGYDEVRATGDTSLLAVKADGDTTFRVTLAAPCAYFLAEVCTAVATMPLRSDAVTKDPQWTSTISVLCNGPYRVGVWARESYLQLRRNASYYENRATGPDVLRFLFAENREEALRLYENGEADYALSLPDGAESGGAVPLRATACVLYYHMSEAFSNDHVRRAFDLSLDRAAVAAAAGAGMTPATGLVPPGVVELPTAGADDFRTVGGALCAVDAEGYSMRCLEAEHELRDGGFWGGVGFSGVALLYVAGSETRAAAAAASAIWNERLKVSVTTEGVSREEFDRRIAAGEYDLALDTLAARGGDAMDCLGDFAGTDGNNAIHYVNKPYDLLIGVAASSRDLAARAAFLHDAEALLLDDAALTPLYFAGASCALREGLSGVRYDCRGNVYFTAVSQDA